MRHNEIYNTRLVLAPRDFLLMTSCYFFEKRCQVSKDVSQLKGVEVVLSCCNVAWIYIGKSDKGNDKGFILKLCTFRFLLVAYHQVSEQVSFSFTILEHSSTNFGSTSPNLNFNNLKQLKSYFVSLTHSYWYWSY